MPHWTVTKERYLSKQEILQLFQSTEKLALLDKQQCRNYWIRCHMLIDLLFSTGMRIGECRAIKHKDIMLNDPEPCLLLNGKGKKKRFVPLNKGLWNHIQSFTQYKRSIGLSVEPFSYFLPSSRNQLLPCSIGCFESMYKRSLQAAGMRERSPHSSRHSFAFSYYAKYRDLRGLQTLLGHEDISSTSIYMSVPFKTLAERVEHIY